MSEFHVQVVRVGEITKHPNADSLGLTKVFDYPVIVRLDDFKPGDLAVYVPVDSIVPNDDPQWAFLDGHNRVKAKKLRGILSMGLLTHADPSWVEGQDVCEAMRITKYEPPEPMTTGGEDEPDPGYMPCYTDIEGLRRYPDVLIPGEEVIISEKVHGCVQANTRISLPDGSRKVISQINEGETVLGMDSTGHVVPSKVLRKYDNGKTDCWLKVTGKRRRAGRGSHFFDITCTPEHRFWNPREKQYALTSDLRPGDPVLLLRSELGMTPIQEQVLLGKMLGDGSYSTNGTSALIVWNHTVDDFGYVEWTAQAIGDLDSGAREPFTSGYGSKMIRCRTTSSAWIKEKFGTFFSTSKAKRVPEWVADELTPIAVAFWYMDDGSLFEASDGSEVKAGFAVCAFTKEECEILIRGLHRFGIDAIYYEQEGYSRLRLNADDAERLFLLIAPYVPPCMQRKLPERYRGHPGWIPTKDRTYKPTLVEQTILSVSNAPPSGFTVRHDLETETGNYFANGALVHNSNARFVFQDGRLWCASHHNWKKSSPDIVWWKAAEQYKLTDVLASCQDLGLYGEVYGRVQDLHYGAGQNDLFLAFFDAWDLKTKRYLDYDEFKTRTEALHLPTVPVLYRGPWSPELRSYAEGPSTVPSANHVREGMVIRPAKERWDDRIGRVVLKIHGEGYLTRKEGSTKPPYNDKHAQQIKADKRKAD